MFLGILTLITALAISAVAIYYSVAGLMTIFAAAAIPIMIMGGALEIGKLVTAVWLHKYWKQATWWLKTYLTTAVIVLMFITSMGIFGFLSKAHIEQTASANEGVAQLERIEAEINRNEQIIARAETKIEELETSGTGATNQLQTQIDREQERIAGAYDRIQPAIQEQNQIIAGVTALFQTELDRIDEELATLQSYIDTGDIRKAQAMVGARADGAFGPRTAAAFTAWQDAKRAERNEWLQKIQDAAQSPTVIAAREEIARLRAGADEQIAESNALINNLRNQLKSNDGNDLQAMLDEQNERVRTASSEIDTLFEQKFQLEAEYRKLEAEVGPVKYIAEFIYGETADNNLLEEAVRWVIIVIIVVFDPLAVLLLIASQYTFEFRRKQLEDDDGERLRLEREEYERARAQRIVDNPGVTFDDPVPTDNDDTSDNSAEEEVDVTAEKEGSGDTTETSDGDGPTTGEDPGDTESVPVEQEDDPQQIEKEVEDATADTTTTDDSMGDSLSKDDIANMYAPVDRMEQTEIQTDEVRKVSKIPDTKNRMFYPEEITAKGLTPKEVADPYIQKKSIELSEEYDADLAKQRTVELDSLEQLPEWSEAKRVWKAQHPDLNLKQFKNDYIIGRIDQLPWHSIAEELTIENAEKRNYIIKDDDGNQIQKETYVQNGEQSDNSIWQRIKRDTDN